MFDFMDMDYSAEPYTPTSGPYLPDAADCLRCGLCVSGCPTFRLTQVQEESPRSRVRTLRKILIENQGISDAEHQHLDNCLQCRACETLCPSHMDYGTMFDQAQAQLTATPEGLAKLALTLIANKTWRIRLLPSLALYLKSGLQKPLRNSGILKKLHLADAEALLAAPALKPLAPHYACPGPKRGKVALFIGCIGEHFDRKTLLAAIKLLNTLGYDVLVPPTQGCCGAIHQHSGHNATALKENNIQAFNALNVDAVLHTASGCGAMLSEYQTDDAEATGLFKKRLQDIHEFLLAHWPDDLQLQALPEKIAVHEPCSHRNVLKTQQAVYGLLAKIPESAVCPLPDNAVCCGAGGSYMLTHPDNAQKLRDLKRQAIGTAAADRTVSSNFVCAAFLNAGGGNITQPLQILAQQLPIK